MVLYIANRSEHDVGSVTHYQALKEIYGEGNVFVIDLRPIESRRDNNYIAYGKYPTNFERIKRWMQGNTMFISNSIINELCEIIEARKIDLVFSEESTLGNLMKKIKKKYPNVKIVCFYHDIAADLYRQWMKKDNIIGKIEHYIGIKQEKLNQKYCDMNLVFHKSDDERFKKYYGKHADYRIPLASPIPKIEECALKPITNEMKKKKVILFVGSSYFPNIVGIRWFYQNVLPEIKGNFQLNIVGRGTEFLKDEFLDERVSVIGYVDSLMPYYTQADIFIAPIFDGGGMKVKSIEAISYGKVFVGTPESLHGFWEELGKVQEKLVFQCNTSAEWIEVLDQLLEGETKHFNSEIYDIFVRKFSYETLLDTLRKII